MGFTIEKKKKNSIHIWEQRKEIRGKTYISESRLRGRPPHGSEKRRGRHVWRRKQARDWEFRAKTSSRRENQTQRARLALHGNPVFQRQQLGCRQPPTSSWPERRRERELPPLRFGEGEERGREREREGVVDANRRMVWLGIYSILRILERGGHTQRAL